MSNLVKALEIVKINADVIDDEINRLESKSAGNERRAMMNARSVDRLKKVKNLQASDFVAIDSADNQFMEQYCSEIINAKARGTQLHLIAKFASSLVSLIEA